MRRQDPWGDLGVGLFDLDNVRITCRIRSTMIDHLELYRDGLVTTTAVGQYAPFGQQLINNEMERTRELLQEVPKPAYPELTTGSDRAPDGLLATAEAGLAARGTLQARRQARAEERAQDIEPYRAYFNHLAPWQREELNAHMEGAAPPIFRSNYEGSDWAAHLAEAPPEQLVNVVQWSADRTMVLNQYPYNQTQIVAARDAYKAKVARAVKAGGLPEAALDTLAKVDEVPVIIGDIFDVELKGRSAYYQPSVNGIALGAQRGLRSFDHEMCHAALGRFPAPLFDEAVNEHITLGLQNGDFTTINPSRRQDEGSYRWKRYMTAQMAEAGVKPVDPSLYTRAYLEKKSNGPAATELVEQTAEAFPGTDDMWTYAAQRSAAHTKLVHERFPEALPSDKLEMGDMYTALSISALGSLKRHMPTRVIREFLDDYADKYHRLLVEAEDGKRPLSVRQRDNLAMEVFTTRRVAQDFEQGTAFLA